ncbi:HAD family phosphatase [Dolichospermum sp. LEGE 00246]|uniref:HAD family hydrolase n=1 Tax=Dolichospermum sp. LEGE 00246 TaxID=1828605 RepID=UPI00188221C5|nr:HAD family hydrolase [Dolichospermum sp. LEGE 00246]MBE9258036.1 HAD family hydrolase [Dolichospermum sp. LEGE 00246]MDK2407586.1 HAD family hydrolase [Aphanizomenon sp. 202]MDK2457620.1 HAD family hydrolase [Aphanizomenon sp. PH219]
MGETGFKLVIFDCDGVLVDSEPIINRTFAETLTEFGFPITYREVTQKFIGKSLKTCLEIIEQSYNKPLPKNFIELCKEREIAPLQQELQPVSGINEVLEQITLPKCVASNNSHRHIQFVLKLTGLLHQFEGKIYSCYDVPRPKPFPDVYLHAAEQMNTNPEHCVVIEDSVPGVQAGYAARMTVFGYAQHSDGTALTDAGAKIVFNDMRQLSQILLQNYLSNNVIAHK